MSVLKVSSSTPAPAAAASSSPALASAATSQVALDLLKDIQEIDAAAPLAGDPASAPTTPKAPEDDQEDTAWWNTDSPPMTPRGSSSSSNSAQTTPEKKGTVSTFSTPSPVKDARKVLKADATCSLIRRETAILEQAFKRLDLLPSPKRSALMSELQSRLVSTLEGVGTLLPIRSTPTAKRQLFFAMENMPELDDWAKEMASRLRVRLIDSDHVTKFIKSSGKHICSPGDPLDQHIINRKTNLGNNIWAGFINQGSGKLSSFVPRDMTAEAFFTLVFAAIDNPLQQLAKGAMKGLYIIQEGTQHFCVEVYFFQQPEDLGLQPEDLELVHLRSAFPIFHFETFSGQPSLKIEYIYQHKLESDPSKMLFERPYDYLIELVRKIKSNDEAIQYETENDLIIDIGMLIGENDKFGPCTITRGIYVSFPKKLLG